MQTVSLTSSTPAFSLYNNKCKPLLSLQSPSSPPTNKLSIHVPCSSGGLKLRHPLSLRFSIKEKTMMKNNRRNLGAVCYAGGALAPYSGALAPYNLQWISTISSVVLLLVKGTAVNKSFLVPLFALQAPATIVSGIKGEYGMWAAFLALLVRLFFFLPGELELPYVALLLVIVAPYQLMNLRGTQAGIIISLVIAGYMAFQHFSWAGSLKKAFDQGSIVATLAVICITVVPCLLLI